MHCSTGKKGYFKEEDVIEALIRSHIRFAKTAINYYYCIDCGEYHLTSKGIASKILSDPNVVKRIEKERRAQDWEGKLR